MRTRTSPSSFMSRWKLAAQMPWYIGAGSGDAEVPPGVGAGPDARTGRARPAGRDRWRSSTTWPRTDLDNKRVVGHVQQIGAGEVLAVRLDFGVLVVGFGEALNPGFYGRGTCCNRHFVVPLIGLAESRTSLSEPRKRGSWSASAVSGGNPSLLPLQPPSPRTVQYLPPIHR